MSLSHSSRSQRGTLIIVAMIFSAVIGISLVSYMQLGRTSLGISNRALYNNAAMNLAENGLEEAMYSINRMIANPGYSWTGDNWTTNGSAATSNAWRSWSGSNYQLDQNASGRVRVLVENYRGTFSPIIVARATVTLGGATAAPIEKWVRVTLRRTSMFANGLVARTSIVFNGTNTSVDSWNSDPDNNPATAAVPYSAGARRDNGSVGSISVGVDAVLVKQADIWGFVATGGTDPTSTVGTGGSILGSTSAYDPSTWRSSNVDPTRVSTDFAANFDPVSAPTKTYINLGGSINSYTVLPRGTDTPDADGNYYYTASNINLTNKYLRVTGKVVLKLTDTSGNVVDVGGGSGSIQIPTGGTLAVYTEGNIKLAGQGVANGTDSDGNGTLSDSEAKQPVNFQVWGTKTTGVQGISIVGQGALGAIVYAPQGDVTINGNGSVAGSVVANNITLTGNAAFHYDESLANFGGGAPFRVSGWTELTTADARGTYSGSLSF